MVRTLTLIALIAVLGLGSVFFVGCQHRGHQRGAAFMVDYLSETLDLNEDQQAMANAYKDEIIAKVMTMHAEKEEMYDEIKVQLGSETIEYPSMPRTGGSSSRSRITASALNRKH